jgi:hypothetical protein
LIAVHRPAGARPTSGIGVALGAAVGVGIVVDVAEGVGAEGTVTGLVDGDATWLALQPPTKPTIPITTTTVESFMSFIAPCPVHGRCSSPYRRQTRMAAIA